MPIHGSARKSASGESSKAMSALRHEASEAAARVAEALTDRRSGGTAKKIVLVRTALTLARRYPIPALCIAGTCFALWMASRHARSRALRY